MKAKNIYICLIIMLSCCGNAMAQDTVHRLDEVRVSATHTPRTLHTETPTQVISAEQLEQQGALQLSDAIKTMAGLTLKDYGGIGGIKTVSARGLGSQFATLTIDGIPVNDAQNGQVDLGRYLLGDASYVSFSNGQGQGLLSASAHAAAGVIDVASAEPMFFMAERTNIRINLEGGSFGLVSPSLRWEQRWGKKIKSSLWVNYLSSKGNYPFTLYYTASRSDSSSREVRQHSAMRMFTADAGLFFTPSQHSRLTTKIHYMRGMHQLPGPVQYYTQLSSAENTAEEVAFIQTKWNYDTSRWKVQVLGKLQRLYDLYEDSASHQTLSGYLMNRYLQHEGYLSGSALHATTSWLELSMAADGSVRHLESNLAQRNDVTRTSLLAVASARLHHGAFEMKANMLATAVTDNVADLDTTPSYRRLSPYIGAMYTLGNITLRAFYKESYRIPTFNELYFFTLPRNLRPERAQQISAGITGGWEHVCATIDAYYNNVADKIVAVPTQSMFLWSMQNIGVVHILGLDATADFTISPLTVHLTYSYQHAVDRTHPDDPYDKTYGHQIAYTPRHSGGATLRWENPWVNIGIGAMAVGERYSRMQNNVRTRLPAYCDINLSVDRRFDLRLGTLTLQLQLLNLFDVQYEVVRSYPMMGRNFRVKASYDF